MTPLLVAFALLSGQVMYEWIDSSGESHFTDDVSTIPKGAKRRPLGGLPEVQRVHETRAPPPPKGAPPQGVSKPSGPDSCQRALTLISKADLELASNGIKSPEDEQRLLAECEQPRHRGGADASERCKASRRSRIEKGRLLQARLADAQEQHRRAQQDGCR